MHEDVPTKAIAACFGLAGFVVAIVCGIFVGNSTEETLSHAIPAMFICVAVGYFIGIFTTRAISNNIQIAAQAAAAAAVEAAETAAKIAQQEAESLGAAGAKSAPTPKGAQASTPISTPVRAGGSPRKVAA